MISSLSSVRQFAFNNVQIFGSRLTSQQQMIAGVALTIFTSVALIYLLFRYSRKQQILSTKKGQLIVHLKTPQKARIATPQELLSPQEKIQVEQLKKGKLSESAQIQFPEETWIADFEKGLLSGSVCLDCSNGTRLEGECKEGVFTGAVQVTFPEGDVWEGQAEVQEIIPSVQVQVSPFSPLKREKQAEDQNLESGEGTLEDKGKEEIVEEAQDPVQTSEENVVIPLDQISEEKGSVKSSELLPLEETPLSTSQERQEPKETLASKPSDVEIYAGELRNGLLDCPWGKMKCANGDEHEGEFKKGKLHGLGKIICKNGDVITGSFKDGLLHGQGKIEYEDGRVFVGAFHAGVLVRSGTLISPTRRTTLSQRSKKVAKSLFNLDKDAKPKEKKPSFIRNLFSKKKDTLIEMSNIL